jgi:hypothetical protein
MSAARKRARVAELLDSETELREVVEVLQRAVAIQFDAEGGGASEMQLKTASNLQQALAAVLQVATADGMKLTSFVQAQKLNEETAAPEAAAHESKSGGIVPTLKGLLDKASAQLDAATKTRLSQLILVNSEIRDAAVFLEKNEGHLTVAQAELYAQVAKDLPAKWIPKRRLTLVQRRRQA